MATLNKHPYKLGSITFKDLNCELVILRIDAKNSMLQSLYKTGLTDDIVNFIYEYAKCVFCNSSILKSLEKCKCNKSKSQAPHLQIKFPFEIYHPIFYPILEKENRRKKIAIRNERLKENGGKHSKQELESLMKIQENLCYFCGAEIKINSKRAKAHADHYESIYLGGTNDMRNIVMTCSTCNLKKGSQSATNFELLIKKHRPPEVSKKLGVIRRRRIRYLQTLNKDKSNLE